MSRINSFADFVKDSEGALEAHARSPEDLRVETEKERLAVADNLGEVKSLKGRQEELTASRQEVTQQLKARVEEGKDALGSLRSVVKGKLGRRNERLVHFKVAPLRKRPRKQAISVKPPDGEASGTKPDASASPSAKPVV